MLIFVGGGGGCFFVVFLPQFEESVNMSNKIFMSKVLSCLVHKWNNMNFPLIYSVSLTVAKPALLASLYLL